MHVFAALQVISLSSSYVESGAGGPDVAIMSGDHCVLNNFGGEELIVDITLPGHVEAGHGVSDDGLGVVTTESCC